MIMLLSREPELTPSESVKFYYKRIRRIMPVYVFVILITLVSCYLLISEFDFGQVVSEAIPALFLYSDFPSVHATEYFDVVGFKLPPKNNHF